jgi:two-component system nitrogen regulation response regulator NtrX
MMKGRILVVDDEESIRGTLRLILEYEGYEYLEAADGRSALSVNGECQPDLILLDIKMPGMDGLELLRRLNKEGGHSQVVVISGHGTIATAVEATKLGAFDFLEKPLEREKLLLTIRNALEQKKLTDENRELRLRFAKDYEMVGKSEAIKEIWKGIEKAAPTTATIFITGESGVGKELVARAVHETSPRRRERFVQVNCAAIPDDLIESELMGHEKGAFTGATERKIGKFELADKGTLFLDEIGDMSLKTQAKLLRALEEGEVERIGGNRLIKVDTRVIAATNKDLKEEIKKGNFREELFYRLNVVPIYVPPLRERREDIPILVDYFTEIFCQENNFKKKGYTREAIQALISFHWPGNVRELKNTVERLLILSPKEVVSREEVSRALGESVGSQSVDFLKATTLREFRQLAEREFILAKLEKHDFNISKTARDLNTPRSNLYKKIKQYGIIVTGSKD